MYHGLSVKNPERVIIYFINSNFIHNVIYFQNLFLLRSRKGLLIFGYVWISGIQNVTLCYKLTTTEGKSYVAVTGKSLGTPGLEYIAHWLNCCVLCPR